MAMSDQEGFVASRTPLQKGGGMGLSEFCDFGFLLIEAFSSGLFLGEDQRQ
jgi:hypothetical protein